MSISFRAVALQLQVGDIIEIYGRVPRTKSMTNGFRGRRLRDVGWVSEFHR